MRWLCVAVLLLCAATSSAVEELPWWRTAVLYQVYPRSFKDSDGDGIGDLKGITQSADYFKEIGVDAIWLSPINESPMADFGYDISNFTAIDPIFGTMEDFQDLVVKMKTIGVKLLIDYVPNHTSDRHRWFQISLNTSHPLHNDYRDFYVWRDPIGWANETTPIPPNNWISIFGGSVWEWWPERQQFYLHSFMKVQPDLNFYSPSVVGNMTNILEFWMDKGVDGFRMDAVPWLIENSLYPDDPIILGRSGNSFFDFIHQYDQNQPETFAMLKYWADVVRRRTLQDRSERAVLLEVYQSVERTMRYYGTGNQSHEYPFNFMLMFLNQTTQYPLLFQQVINQWMSAMPAGAVPNWAIGNHDNQRVATRCGPEMVDAMNLLTGVLPGVMCIYNGEEMGMEDTFIRPDERVDFTVSNRDAFRSPIQWDDSLSAGFSTNPKTWLPVNPNYWWLNVAAQRNAETSHLKVFQALAQARKDPVLQRGDLNVLVPNNNTLIVVRYYNGTYFTLIINTGSQVDTYTSENLFMPNKLDLDMSVVVTSVNSGYNPGMLMRRGSISLTLNPKAAILLKTMSSSALSSAIHSFSLSSCLIFILAIFYR